MKKVALGCGLVLLVTGIAASIAGYYVFRQVSSTVSQLAELSQLPELERTVRNQSPYSPPASGEFTESQIEKLLRVQSDVRQRIGVRMQEFESRYQALTDKADADLTDAPALLRAYGDLAATWLDAKRAQVEALNATGLSIEEYRWVRNQAYSALGQAFVDFDIGRLVDQARRGVTSDSAGQLKGALEPTGPESNRQHAGKHKKALTENVALASFGL